MVRGNLQVHTYQWGVEQTRPPDPAPILLCAFSGLSLTTHAAFQRMQPVTHSRDRKKSGVMLERWSDASFSYGGRRAGGTESDHPQPITGALVNENKVGTVEMPSAPRGFEILVTFSRFT